MLQVSVGGKKSRQKASEFTRSFWVSAALCKQVRNKILWKCGHGWSDTKPANHFLLCFPLATAHAQHGKRRWKNQRTGIPDISMRKVSVWIPCSSSVPAACPALPSCFRRKGQKARLEGSLEEKVKEKWNKKQSSAKGKSVKSVTEISICKSSG